MQKLTILLFTLLLSGCSLFHTYHMDIQQGNVLKPEDIAKVKVGMSKADVDKTLGKPMLVNAYDANQSDYVYTMQISGGQIKQQQVIVYFTDGKVSKVTQNNFPEDEQQ